MNKILCAVALVFSVGCATATFRPYVGQQQNWPTAIGSIVNTHYDLPIFTSLPSAPYDVLGELRVSSPFYAQPEEGHMPVMVKKGVEVGADAIVFVDGAEYFRVPYGERTPEAEASQEAPKASLTQVNRFLPESFRQGVTFIAVKWVKGPPPGLEAAPMVLPAETEKKPVLPAVKAEPVPPPAPAQVNVPPPAVSQPASQPVSQPVSQPALPPLKQPAPTVAEKPAPVTTVQPTTNFGPRRSATP